MAATKDSPSSTLATASRPLPSQSASLNAVPAKMNHTRNTSASSSVSTHRITRRKSVSSNGTNLAAVAQAVKEAADAPFPASALHAGVARTTPKPVDGGLGIPGYPSPPSSLPTSGPLANAVGAAAGSLPQPSFAKQTDGLGNERAGSVIADGHAPEVSRAPRNRRASEGTRAEAAASGSGVVKSSRVRSGSELKCDKCGKGYKHSSCLTKHLWEHTPEWSYTSKLLISKHQQVQLLEAASILVAMNPAPTPPASSSGTSNNDGNSSANESSSSEDTTPPPALGAPGTTPRGIRTGSGKPGKRYSSGSYSRSANGGFLAGTTPPAASFPNHLQRSAARPRAGSFVNGVKNSVGTSPALRPVPSTEDDALAAAVELLSCSFHTPAAAPGMPGTNIPRSSLGDLGSPPAGGRSYVRPLNDVVEMKKEEEEDIQMEDTGDRGGKDDDEEDEAWRRGRSEEDEDGVFGKMEE